MLVIKLWPKRYLIASPQWGLAMVRLRPQCAFVWPCFLLPSAGCDGVSRPRKSPLRSFRDGHASQALFFESTSRPDMHPGAVASCLAWRIPSIQSKLQNDIFPISYISSNMIVQETSTWGARSGSGSAHGFLHLFDLFLHERNGLLQFLAALFLK